MLTYYTRISYIFHSATILAQTDLAQVQMTQLLGHWISTSQICKPPKLLKNTVPPLYTGHPNDEVDMNMHTSPLYAGSVFVLSRQRSRTMAHHPLRALLMAVRVSFPAAMETTWCINVSSVQPEKCRGLSRSTAMSSNIWIKGCIFRNRCHLQLSLRKHSSANPVYKMEKNGPL